MDQCYQKASSNANLAMQLIKRSYSRKERTNSNCAGDHRYKKKLSPNRMQAVKDALSTQSGQDRKQKTTGEYIELL